MVGKRGSLFDVVTILGFLFALVFIIFIGFKIYGGVHSAIDVMPNVPSAAKAAIDVNYAQFPKVWDGIFLFLFVGLLIASIIGAYYSFYNPLFFVLAVFFLVVICVVALVFGNSYEQLLLQPELSSLSSDFPIIHFFMSNVLLFAIVSAVLICVALFVKPSGGAWQ